MLRICDICNKEIKKEDNFNFFFNKYTHNDCDLELLEKIDKNIKVVKNRNIVN